METKQLKEAIRDALVPHLVGIRHDLDEHAKSGAEAKAHQAEAMADAVVKALAQLSDPIGHLSDSIKALAEKPPAPVEVTNLVEIRIEGAESAKLLNHDDEGGAA